MTEAETLERGREALAVLLDPKQRGSWASWYLVAEAIQIGRQKALKDAKTGRFDHNYRRFFAKWLSDNGFARLEGTLRLSLFTMLEHRKEIEAWRQNLIDTEAFESKLNNPDYLVRKWKYRNRS
jgi:hypothetical protein